VVTISLLATILYFRSQSCRWTDSKTTGANINHKKMMMKNWIRILPLLLALIILSSGSKKESEPGNQVKSENWEAGISEDDYEKFEFRIPMRDGVRLFTSVYIPIDKSEKYPILMNRTPYSVAPYGEGKKSPLHPSRLYVKEKFIFVYQDVRGCFMSEGKFVNMRPQLTKYESKDDIDETTDTWDTVDWLIKNIHGNNGNVGIWGISYPGFYAAVASINAHPAIKAISPQAPIADWFFDDFHHHGAFFLPHAFGFLAVFGQPRSVPTTHWGKGFEYSTPDGYQFYLEEVGPLSNVNKKYYKNKIAFWNKIVEHPNYDDFWQKRNLLPHLRDIKPAILVVGGWFDAEDLYGPLNIYEKIETGTPGAQNFLVMGPWRHGGWARGEGDNLGNVKFDSHPGPSVYFREQIEFPFFMKTLKTGKTIKLAEATMYNTGQNKWIEFDKWPPVNIEKKMLFLQPDGEISETKPGDEKAFREYISDPAKPVPFTQTISTRMTRAYMTDDQRFASRRPDVLVYQTDILEENITLAGKIIANLFVSISETDSDWIVKLIDVYPNDTPNNEFTAENMQMAGYQQMVRSEVFRGRFRNSYEFPEPFVPGEITNIQFPLQDVLHTFKKGHRLMIQIQSSWFPIVDRNPQKYVDNIFNAGEEDFIPSIQRVYSFGENGSNIEINVLKN